MKIKGNKEIHKNGENKRFDQKIAKIRNHMKNTSSYSGQLTNMINIT